MEKITIDNPDFDWGRTIRKGLSTFGWSALGYVATEFSSEVIVAAALGTAVPLSVKIPVASLLAGLFKSVANYAKTRRLKIDAGDGTNGTGTAIPAQGFVSGPRAIEGQERTSTRYQIFKPFRLPFGVVLCLSLFASIASAQNVPSVPCSDELKGCLAELSLDAGMLQFAKQGQDRKDFTYRLNASVGIPYDFRLEARGDWTRTQDGGNLFDPKTFKSIEAYSAVSRPVLLAQSFGLDILALAGVSWNRDQDFDPQDPRLWTLGGCVRARHYKLGSAMQCIAHHGPVGGAASLTSITYNLGSGAWWFGDMAIPLSHAAFIENPYTVKFGIVGRLKFLTKRRKAEVN